MQYSVYFKKMHCAAIKIMRQLINLGTRWTRMISFTFQPPCPHNKKLVSIRVEVQNLL